MLGARASLHSDPLSEIPPDLPIRFIGRQPRQLLRLAQCRTDRLALQEQERNVDPAGTMAAGLAVQKNRLPFLYAILDESARQPPCLVRRIYFLIEVEPQEAARSRAPEYLRFARVQVDDRSNSRLIGEGRPIPGNMVPTSRKDFLMNPGQVRSLRSCRGRRASPILAT